MKVPGSSFVLGKARPLVFAGGYLLALRLGGVRLSSLLSDLRGQRAARRA